MRWVNLGAVLVGIACATLVDLAAPLWAASLAGGCVTGLLLLAGDVVQRCTDRPGQPRQEPPVRR